VAKIFNKSTLKVVKPDEWRNIPYCLITHANQVDDKFTKFEANQLKVTLISEGKLKKMDA
jgi:hypothetical protein